MTLFSNSTEFDIWASGWCYRCANDELGGAEEGILCPILCDVMANDDIPSQWTEGDGIADYSCSEFIEA